MREIQVHVLVGAQVKDPLGASVGRIEELCVERRDNPNAVSRRGDSPVAPTTKIPSPRLAYAISFPSGE